MRMHTSIAGDENYNFISASIDFEPYSDIAPKTYNLTAIQRNDASRRADMGGSSVFPIKVGSMLGRIALPQVLQ